MRLISTSAKPVIALSPVSAQSLLNYLGEKMILRKSDRPRRKLMRVTSLVAPIVGALLALGFMTGSGGECSDC